MPLPDVLSAIRVLVLDDPPLAEDPQAREAELARRFPNLTPQERADLAAVPPERLRVYTNLIFAGMREMVRWAYPLSLGVIVEVIRAEGDDRPEGEIAFDLMRELHRFRPWRHPSTRELAAHFRDFIETHNPQWLRARPMLASLLDFEQVEVDVFYAEDAPGEPFRLDEITSLSVEAFMGLEVMRPLYVVLREYPFDVPAWARDRRREEDLAVEEPPPDKGWFACGRDPDSLMPHWVRLENPAERAAIQSVGASGRDTVQRMAEAYLASRGVDAEADPQAAFVDFFERFARWAQAGVVLRPTA
ncbi:MAG: hypothetical protein D6788_04725 [Planctomycetota bacterium]|nr:MAG: hypothetical protein D6788_04725 [Planctomycetota bacterium]